jgi:endonuclease/exonuclease/phosphatase family metal-dependent hydrolase
LRIATTHLGLPPLMRLRQLQQLLKACDPGAKMPFVLLGDLNVLPLLDPAGRMLHRVFGVGSREATYPSRFPLLALDRIAMRGANGADNVQVWRTNGATLASDHLPLVADLELGEISSS